jgi:two-component system OmpR family sensor kinase
MADSKPRLVRRVAATSAIAAALGGSVAAIFAGVLAGRLVTAHEDEAVLAAATELAEEIDEELDEIEDEDDDDRPATELPTLEWALAHELEDVKEPGATAAVVQGDRTIAGDTALPRVAKGRCRSDEGLARRVCAAPLSEGRLVLLSVSAESERERWTLFAWALLCGALVGAGAGGALSYRSARWAMDPVIELRDRVRKIDAAAPRSDALEPEARHAEVEELRRSIAQLVDRLADALAHATAFSAHAAHELRTPLSLLAGELELLVEDDTRPSEDRDALRRIHRAVRDVVELTERLLVLARPGRSPAEHGEAIDLSDVAQTVRDALPPEHRDRVHVIAEDDVIVRGDFELLRSAMHNAVENSLKFSDGEVRVHVSGGASAVIDVIDRGPGIAPEEAREVFAPFYRSGRSAKPGHGIGLALVAHVADAHGGTAEFVDAPVGAHMRIRLPRWSSGKSTAIESDPVSNDA